MLSAFSQNPEFAGRPYLWQNNVALSDLERADAQLDSKLKGLGYGGVRLMYTVFSGRSNVRFNRNHLQKLIIKVAEGIDPSESYTIVKAEVKKDKRSFLVSSYSMVGRAKDTKDTYIKAEFKRIKDGIYEITLPSDIEEGEYGFLGVASEGTLMGNRVKISCFGID